MTSEDEEEKKKKEANKYIKIEGLQQANAKTDKEKEIEFNLNKMDERLGEIGFGKPLDNLDEDKMQWMNPNNWRISNYFQFFKI